MLQPSAVAAAAPSVRAGRREWTGLAVLMLPLLLVSMDVSVLYFAVPFISADLAPSGTQQLWIFDIYGFVLAGLLVTMGVARRPHRSAAAAADRRAAFGAASVLAAYAHSAEMLIAARALLGVAGATLMPSTLALVRNDVPRRAATRHGHRHLDGRMTGGIALGPVLSRGPAGALLVGLGLPDQSARRWCCCWSLGPVLLPESRDARPGRFDLVSAALSLAAVLPVICGIKQWAADGLRPSTAIAILVGLASAPLFVRPAAARSPTRCWTSACSGGRQFAASLVGQH